MTTAKAAEYLGVNNSRVRQLVREGLLKVEREDTQRGPVFWFTRQALDECKAHREQLSTERRGKRGRPLKRPDGELPQ